MREPIISIELNVVDSTHLFVKRNYRDFLSHEMTRVSARAQTDGRGRMKKKWVSFPSENLYLSYFVLFPKTQIDLSNLAQVVTIAAIKLLEHDHLQPHIKWPNDLFIKSKKIGGVLCELVDLIDQLGAILSLGLNVNATPLELDKIDQPSTSMHLETGRSYSLKALIATLDPLLTKAIEHYKAKGFRPFYPTYKAHLIGEGGPITYRSKGITHHALFESLTPDGRLIVRFKTGERETLNGGEIKWVRFSK